MNDILLMLIIGFVAGGAVSSIIWAIAGSGRKKKLEAEEQARREVMDSVTTLLADADGIETKYRNGELSVENFRRNLGDKCNAALKILRENMIGFDGFFVRYADQEIREYLRVADNPERRKDRSILDSRSDKQADLGTALQAMPSANTFAAAIQTFGAAAPSAFPPPALKVNDAPPPKEEIKQAKGTPDLFEPSKPIKDVSPKITLKPYPEPAPVVEPTAVVDVVDIAPKGTPSSIATEPKPVVDTTPLPDAVVEIDVAAANVDVAADVEDIAPQLETPPAAIVPKTVEDIAPKPEPVADVADTAPQVKPQPSEVQSVFDLPVTAPPAQEGDVWSEQSIEEFEAAFAQFEDEPATPKAAVAEEHIETGSFPLSEALDDFETPTMEIPMSAVQAIKPETIAAPIAPPVQAAVPSTTPSAQAVAPSTAQSVQTAAAPSTTPPVQPIRAATAPPATPPPAVPVVPPPAVATPAPKQQDSSGLGITGDDVFNAMENMFNSK